MATSVLRLRRRRDGALCLVDADARIGSTDAEFPARHLFSAAWLLTSGVATLSGDTLTVALANAAAEYRVVSVDQAGNVDAELVSSRQVDLPPVDEHRAFEIQLERRDREVGSIAREFGVDDTVAEAIAVKFHVIPPAPREWAEES